MKKLMLMMAVAMALFSCGQKQGETAKTAEASADSLGGTLTGLDEKTQVIKAQTQAYIDQDTTYAGDAIADNVQIYYPNDTIVDVKDKKAFLADFKGQYKNWKNVKFDRLRVVTLKLNNGEVWTNLWGVMIAKGNFTGKDILIPIHRAIMWQNDQVVRDIHLYDTKLIMEELAARAAAEKK
jgi:hypothetical protein